MIYVVGLGPGRKEEMTGRALAALERCDTILGYRAYIDLVRRIFPDKDLRASPMKAEVERCREALELALSGRTVGLVSSGDPGVYGMAGLMLEVAGGRTDVEVVPGVTAANSAAALLGAPLMHDFAVISLSDLLTPWNLIERRLDAVAAADFVVCLYNPVSRGRPTHLQWACDILLRYKAPETVAGWARSVGREEEKRCVTTLGKLRDAELDMFCTAIVGNIGTTVMEGRMVTPRGYRFGVREEWE
ncbi:precorrin-3B C(17)-methyltransferase [uncultured Fretibacterium sp.]|uniref:precorrin-3B C(17)-methyltransferase n=1 Tax=uncultured Fretibacterium sp. TaxID=1678694 RepID=UPI0026043C6B|nr:precorrin-3B C(17)-methyltransferase [uncultured Fretibacterium sp.]